MTIVQILLAPFTLIYKSIAGLRNHMFNLGKKKSHHFSVFTIGVGNLRVGGTGKTPFSEYLLSNFLDKGLKTAYLSRGYGRKTKGFVEVSTDKSSREVGDESLQIKSKFNSVDVAVCEERIIGIPELLFRNPEIQTIVLDDVYQHRHVKPHVQILLTAYDDLFYEDYVLPMGRLRERRQGAKRADVIVVTKCPKEELNKKEEIKANIYNYTDGKQIPIFFSNVTYCTPKVVLGNEPVGENVIVLSALAKNKPFVDYCKSKYNVVKSFEYSDHHQFSEIEIKEIVKFAISKNESCILTTEKDWQRLKLYKEILEAQKIIVAVVSIKMKIEEEQKFWRIVNDGFENI